ncbi:MAG TPA: hypothetical protein VEX60_15320 [Pyrinomonadaceae bacterium]|nr:hypothetical protein [Pyrinomonadaceae bacterium]
MEIVRSLDLQFARLHERSHALVQAVPSDRLYWQPPVERARTFPVYSCGEHILRSAAAVEQTFGGITANLWDDPFEWTLPEALTTPAHVAEYLNETEATRLRAFQSIRSDRDLSKEIATPSGEMRSLYSLLAETLARAAHHQGRAFATFRLFSDARLPRI